MADTTTHSPLIEDAHVRPNTWRDYLELSKWRLNAMVLLTTLIGYVLAAGTINDWSALLNAMLGVWLAAVGASAVNQYLERSADARMERTRRRPLPDRRLGETQALQFGAMCLVGGIMMLALLVNLLSAFLCVLTAVTYLFLYTPLKRISPANTLVGAIPGALPPVIGWAAAKNELSIGSLVLFAIMFCWQLPHFFAISWMYRDDYIRGGMKMISGLDTSGRKTAQHMVMCTLNLIFVSLLPCIVRSPGHPLAGSAYFLVALALGLVFLTLALRFWFQRSPARARTVMLGSLLYLPALLVMWLLDAQWV